MQNGFGVGAAEISASASVDPTTLIVLLTERQNCHRVHRVDRVDKAPTAKRRESITYRQYSPCVNCPLLQFENEAVDAVD